VTYDWGVVWENRWLLLDGARTTLVLTVLTMVFAIVGGLLLAILRLSSFRIVRASATAFVEFFRATPLILQIYWVFYILPTVLAIRFPAFTTGLVGLTLNVSAFNSETFRAGITSIRRGQWYAGLALGMSRAQVMRHVVLPQAVWRILPPLASQWVSLFKDTSLVSTIAVADLSYVALGLRFQTYRIIEILTAMAGLYWLMGYPQAKLVDWIHRKFEVVE
jgi:polar amino acid transport system permease protein